MHKNLIFAAAVTALTLPAGFATAEEHSDTTATTVVATVNGTEITLGELIIARAQLPAQYQQLPAEVLFEGLLDQLVQQQLLADQLEGEPMRMKLALANEERSLRAGEIVNQIYEDAVSDDALQGAYDARIAEMGEAIEWNASHILVETEEEARAVKEIIDAGADFAETAKERSTGPSGPNGGELGWFSAGMMVAPFEEAVSNMEAGGVSDPVETQFGWHIVKLNETRMQDAPSLDDLRDELTGQLQEQALQARLDALGETAEVALPAEGDFDPEIINNLELLEAE